MVRRLMHASVACLLAVCVTPGIASISAETRVDRVHVAKGSIAAGRFHSVMATPDGRVLAWGRGRRGQIGDDELSDRLLPTTVSVPGAIVSVAAGAAHTVAVTREGAVYAWGANSFGRLGDGTRRRRAKPVRVAGLASIIQVAAGQAHTLALSADGKVYAWGRNTDGQLGTGNKVMSLVPVRIRELTDIVAIAAGAAHSLAVTRSGQLLAWGSNQHSRLGDGTAKDRNRPVAVALSDVVAVAAGAAHSLALVRDGAVYSWGRGANGELGTGSMRVAPTPTAIPGLTAAAIAAGSQFSAAIRVDGSVVAWGANDSGQLGDRSTVRRSRPVVVGGVSAAITLALGDSHAIAVTDSGDVRTWGAGGSGQLGTGTALDRSFATEVMSDIPDWGVSPGGPHQPADTVPPSITTDVSPPWRDGWMTTPVTVSFDCDDDVGVRSCSSPVTMTTDGYRQVVTGTAVDFAGNAASASVELSLDLSPPVLSIAEPRADTITTETEIVVHGHAHDGASGLAEVRCNGQPAVHAGGAIRCVVALKPGRNQILLQARDAVGFTAGTSLIVTRASAASSLVLTPATRTLELNEVATLSLRDEFGAPVEHASWTSDSEIVALSADDPPRISARALGTATITAVKDGLSADAVIAVSAGLLPGDTRWSLPVNFTFSVDLPLFANRVAADVPLLFTVEAKSRADAILRAMSAEGELLWQQHVDGMPIMGDSFGGVIVGVVEGEHYRAYARLGGGTIQPWRYDSAGRLGRPAQSADGTIYAVERLFAETNSNGFEVWDKYALVLDGVTGSLLSRTLLPREISHFYSARDGELIDIVPPGRCLTTLDSNAPETLEPIGGADGRGYLVVRRFRQIKHGDCYEQINELPDRTIEMGLDLLTLSRTEPPHSTNLYSTSCVAGFGTLRTCDYPVHAAQIMPDGIGGTVIVWDRGGRVEDGGITQQRLMTRVAADGTSEHPVSTEFSLHLVGQAGMAIAADGEWKGIDLRSGTFTWTSPLELTPLAARPEGGFAAVDSDSGELREMSAGGALENSQPFGLWHAVHEGGDWIGLENANLVSVVGEFSDATRFRAGLGNAQSQLSVRHPGKGIFAKTHLALEPFPFDLIRIRHVSIRVTPHSWQSWVEKGVELKGTDEFGNGFFTIGAGSNSTDTTLRCAGLLVSAVNRTNDYLVPPWDALEKLSYAVFNEDSLIQSLLDNQAAYRNDLPYACRPEANPGFYNSNSFAHGLLNAAGLPEPRFPARFSGLIYGWLSPVPLSNFH